MEEKKSYIEEFFIKLNKLEPTEIYGVALLLGANLLDEDKSVEDLVVIMAEKLKNLPRKKRRELFKIMDKAAKGGKSNVRTKNSKASL